MKIQCSLHCIINNILWPVWLAACYISLLKMARSSKRYIWH